MAWDSTRKVPWRRVLKPFGIYAIVAAAVLLVATRRFDAGILVGLIGGGLIYAALVTVLVKFGWNPPIFMSKEERAEAAAAAAEKRAARRSGRDRSSSTPATHPSTGRPAPTPTKRTNSTNPRAKARPRR
jgi:nucleotide-binding universal stress UspA family protein